MQDREQGCRYLQFHTFFTPHTLAMQKYKVYTHERHLQPTAILFCSSIPISEISNFQHTCTSWELWALKALKVHFATLKVPVTSDVICTSMANKAFQNMLISLMTDVGWHFISWERLGAYTTCCRQNVGQLGAHFECLHDCLLTVCWSVSPGHGQTSM